jgi:hypothetical protein
MDFVRAVRPHQATFVPDSVGQFTSDHGWDLAADGDRLRPLIDECACAGRARQPVHGPAARRHGAGRASRRRPRRALHRALCRCARHAAAGRQLALCRRRAAALAAGPGRQRRARPEPRQPADFLRAVPGVMEVSIGHALIADALELGIADDRARLPALHPRQPGRDRRHRHRHLRPAPHAATLERRGERFAAAVLGPSRAAGLPRPRASGPRRAAWPSWPRASRPRRPSPRPSAWACACR